MLLYEKNLPSITENSADLKLQLLQLASDNPNKLVKLFVRERNARIKAERLAEVDEITHILLNKRGWRHVLKKEGYHLARHREQFAIFFMDMDNLKKVNDTFGHEMGTRYIKIFAEVLNETMRPEDTTAHPQGDEFWAMMPRIKREEAEEYRDKLVVNFQIKLDALDKDDEFYRVAQTFPQIGPSVGIAHKRWSDEEREYLMNGTREETINKVYIAMSDVLKVADEDLYRVKKRRKMEAKTNKRAFTRMKTYVNPSALFHFGMKPLGYLKGIFS